MPIIKLTEIDPAHQSVTRRVRVASEHIVMYAKQWGASGELTAVVLMVPVTIQGDDNGHPGRWAQLLVTQTPAQIDTLLGV